MLQSSRIAFGRGGSRAHVKDLIHRQELLLAGERRQQAIVAGSGAVWGLPVPALAPPAQHSSSYGQSWADAPHPTAPCSQER